jgi:hypothetical protein
MTKQWLGLAAAFVLGALGVVVFNSAATAQTSADRVAGFAAGAGYSSVLYQSGQGALTSCMYDERGRELLCARLQRGTFAPRAR